MQTILRRCKFVLFSFLIVFATRCSDSDELPSGEYTTGVFVVNEGNFGEADGSISYYNRSTGEVRQDLFGRENSNRALGDVVQSIATHQNFTYIVVNNSNKVEVVDANTFKAVYTVNDVRLPRYMTIHGNKAYITEWVSFTDPGRVSILDLDTRVVEGTVTTDYGAEQLLVHNNKLYVSNNFSNTVSVVNLSSKTLLKNILVGPSPSALLIDKDNTLWVVSNGGYDANYNPLNNGAFYQINTTTDEVERSISLNINLSGKVAINGNKDVIYYAVSKNIYALDISADAAPANPLITQSGVNSFYGLGFDAEEETLYAADAKGFAGNGVIYRYKKDGTFINSFEAGRGPNGFLFK